MNSLRRLSFLSAVSAAMVLSGVPTHTNAQEPGRVFSSTGAAFGGLFAFNPDGSNPVNWTGNTFDSGPCWGENASKSEHPTVTKLQLKVNFNLAKPNADSCTLTGTLALEPGFSVTNRVVTVDIGGAQASFTLDAKGRGISTPHTCKLSYNRKTGLWTFTASLKKGSWAVPWAAHGLTNAPTPKAGVAVTLPVTVVIDAGAYANEKSLLYKAAYGKSGSAK